MRILAVDTALGACSAAVLDGETVCAHHFELMERGHAERLAPMVSDVMRQAALEFPALDRLAVTVGPGTFTGQRVGYAFMRGLRLALERPLVGVTTLAAMAEAALAKSGARAAAVLHDAKRGEVYVTVAANGAAVVPVQLATFDRAIEMAHKLLPVGIGPIAIAGTAGEMAAQHLRALGRSTLETGIVAPDALWVARVALGAPAPDNVPPPLYLRAPDARLPQPNASELRAATLADLPVLARLHGQCFSASWDMEFLGQMLAQPGAFFVLATEKDDAIGFVIARAVGGEAEILSLGVLPDRRRKGLGAAMVRKAAEWAAQEGAVAVFLEVSIENGAARALYDRLGFCEVGRRREYYSEYEGPGRDALVLKRALPL